MIYDVNDNRITATALTAAPDSEKLFTLHIQCTEGYSLLAVPTPGVTISAKAETGDPFTDIVADPLDLSAFAPDIKPFFFKIEVAEGTDLGTELELIRVAKL